VGDKIEIRIGEITIEEKTIAIEAVPIQETPIQETTIVVEYRSRECDSPTRGSPSKVRTARAPKLLVEWSSPWREFVGSIRPALARSERRLAGEAPFGLIPLRIMVPSYFLEAFLIFAAIAIQMKIAELRPFVAPRFSSHDVIYYSGDELPRTQDLGGAAGRNHRPRRRRRSPPCNTQTIKIARGGSLVPKVVDAPNLKLHSSHDAVANLLAIKPDPGPPPIEGLRSTRTAPNLATTLVAPAPNVIRDYTRNGIQLDYSDRSGAVGNPRSAAHRPPPSTRR
jgi:hypothetical protein